MNIKYSIALAVSLFCLSEVSVSGQGFDDFSSESEKAKKELQCQNSKTTPASYGMGALYGCIQGEAQTVKWFINEIVDTNKVENIKLMWNDWFKDRGFGVHADKKEAYNALRILTRLYAPDKSKELDVAFKGSQDKTIRTANYILKYTYTRGPAIDERLVVVTENKKSDAVVLTEINKEAESRNIIAELKHIPMSDVQKNLDLYEKLVAYNPGVAKYQRKVNFYTEKLEDELNALEENDSKQTRAGGWYTDTKSNCKVWVENFLPKNTMTYSGKCITGKAHGRGSLTFYENGKKVGYDEGGFKDGKHNGKGSETIYGNEVKIYYYVGGYIDGMRNGKGSETWNLPNGKRLAYYKGYYKNSLMHGKGDLTIYDDGKVIQHYVGEFKDGEKHGHGTITLSDGISHDGLWESGNRLK